MSSKNIQLLDIQEIQNFSHSSPDGIVVIMPCIDAETGMKTAEILYRRAGMPCTILVVLDTLRQGFIKTLNQTAVRVTTTYIVYLAQDAWPGRGWLKCAYESLERSGKGLLAFNDGKWQGKIASFGMVRLSWVKTIYNGNVFFPGYRLHGADNELTEIARFQGMYQYNPECTLMEYDPDKDFGGSNPKDKALFEARLQQDFDGMTSMKKIKNSGGQNITSIIPSEKAHYTLQKGVSIIIPTLNAARHLDKLLSSFFRINTFSPLEFIIVDHGSNDNTFDILKKYMTKGFVRLIKRNRNYSFSNSCNFGASKAKYPHLLFLNNDIIYTNDVLLKAIDKLDQDPGIGAVGVRLDDDLDSLVPGEEQKIQHLGIEFKWNEKRGYYQPEQIRHPSLKQFLYSPTTDHQQLTTVYAVTGAFLLCRSSDFRSLNGFNEEYFYGLEDIDFCLRLGRHLNKKCWCISDISLQHVEGATRKSGDLNVRRETIDKNHKIFKEKWDNYIRQMLGSPFKDVEPKKTSVFSFCAINKKLWDFPSIFKKHARPLEKLMSSNTKKVAVVVHVFYPEIWSEISSKLKKISCPFDLFITAPISLGNTVLKEVSKDFPVARFQFGDNQGMDILPFLSLVPTLVNENYQLTLKLHTKKGTEETGESWRKIFFDALIGSQDNFELAVRSFSDENNICMAGPALLFQSAKKHMYENENLLQEVLNITYGKNIPKNDWGFFAGSMFWVKTDILKKLSSIVTDFDLRNSSRYKNDGNLEHAVERFFGLLPILHEGKTALFHMKDPYTTNQVIQTTGCSKFIGIAPTSKILHQYSTLKKDVQKINKNNQFDYNYYVKQVPEIEKIQFNPIIDYLFRGIHIGLKPSNLLKSIGSSSLNSKEPVADTLSMSSKLSGRIKQDIDIISKSGLLDFSWYIQNYPDIMNQNVDPVQEYCVEGWIKRRDPCPGFSTKYYLESNPDVASACINPFVHYILRGKNEGRKPLPKDLSTTSCSQDIIDAHYVKYVKASFINFHPPAKAICFYLPQYHEIPENNTWWGKGFTEWTNVRPAKPQFPGHYQPRIPGELGYYNLLDPSILKRQIELAKSYGIYGFCLYYYWFGGKRLLERPLENYLKDPSLDFPFCLCWANENWTRRWDGLENDVLMAQKHSPEDDIAFITDVARFLRDQRYIRVDGRPLLVVYRPSLLPSAEQTAYRWRKWCRVNGVGEIYLALTHSFDKINPQEIGYDAAIEFPPNNQSPPDITKHVPDTYPDFKGRIYDWTVFPERSRNYSKPEYPLFRGVCPSWDNTARKKNKGNILYGSSPRGYQNWLYNAIINTTGNWPVDNRFVFINAWNEWAEAAYLEPDAKYGYAYLDATRVAMLRSEEHLVRNSRFDNSDLAVVVHAFYPEILDEIIQRLCSIKNINFKIYVTSPPDKSEDVKKILNGSGLDFYHFTAENRGRDVLPFFKILRIVIQNRHSILLKLHTKRSVHRIDGRKWRNDIYEKLLNPVTASKVLDFFSGRKEAGIIGPQNHILPMDCYWGSNEEKVLQLSSRLGLHKSQVFSSRFVAGTMFYARTSIFLPVLGLVDESSFEEEKSQIDGTLAHAFERLFSVCAAGNGLKIYDTSFIDSENLHEANYRFVN
jgi:lipopolysaccharide biosynthesis protein/GT2 family glycosyltransferase